MKKETIDIGQGRIEVSKDGNLIYFKIYGEFTDVDVMKVTEYMENFFTEIGGPTIRIWDGTSIPPDQFKLTAQGTYAFMEGGDPLPWWAFTDERERRIKQSKATTKPVDSNENNP